MENDTGSQQDETLEIGSRAEEQVECAQCEKQLLGSDAFTHADGEGATVYLCATCRDAVEQVIQQETENPNVVSALLAGVVAGVVGAGVVKITYCKVRDYLEVK